MLTIVLVLFSVGSVVCALARSIEVLIAGRVIQGVAGGVFPLAFGIINDEFPAEQPRGGDRPHVGDVRHRRRHRPAALGRHRRQRRHLVALLDRPHRAARRGRRLPPRPAVARRASARAIDWAGAVVLSLGLVARAARHHRRRTRGAGARPSTLGAARRRRRDPRRLRRARAAHARSRSSTCACSPSAPCSRRTSPASSSAWRCSARSCSSRSSRRRPSPPATASA